MKKIIVLFMTFFSGILITNALEVQERYSVELIRCESANEAWVELNGEVKRIRLLAYDPSDSEITSEINDYVCNLFSQATSIEIEYDLESETKDAYNRELVWVYLDGKLLQQDLISKGYGQVNFVSGNYTYLTDLCASQKDAILNKSGIWSFPDMEEAYCDSGLINEDEESQKETTQENTRQIDKRLLHYIIFLNSGIVLLLLIWAFMRRRNRFEKK